MTRDEAVARIKLAFGDRLKELKRPAPNRLYIEVDSHVVPETTRILFDDFEARLQTASGVDAPDEIEVLYHWGLDRLGLVVTIRTHIDRERPEIASITAICPAAEWIEREMWELLGIRFNGHPNLGHLLLTDDWPEGQYPLRRDYRKA